jgi:hypothetical protein
VKKKPIKILKKPTGSVRFRFYKSETEKTEPNPSWKKTKPNRKKTESNRKKPSKTELKPSQTEKTEPNRFEQIFVLKNRNRIETGSNDRFRFGSVFLKNTKFSLINFLIKTEPNRNRSFEPVSIRFRFFRTKTEPNWFEQIFILKNWNRIETRSNDQFWFGLVF